MSRLDRRLHTITRAHRAGDSARKLLAAVPITEIPRSEPDPFAPVLLFGTSPTGEPYKVLAPNTEILLVVIDGRPTRRVAMADLIYAILEA
jgi:hypothetical protein